MKIPGAFFVLLAAASPVLAQYPAPKTTPPAPAPSSAAKKASPPAKAPTPAKKEEAPGKIEGMEIPRGDKGYLGLQVVNSVFKLSFYDTKKKPTAPDVTRAVLRWDPKYKVGKERVVLAPGGGPNSLTSEKSIRPPYNFKLFITLTKEGVGENADEPPGETIVVDFRQ